MMGNVPVNFELERPECSEENEAAALQLSLSGVSIKDDHDQLILHDVSFEMHKAETSALPAYPEMGRENWRRPYTEHGSCRAVSSTRMKRISPQQVLRIESGWGCES